LPVSVNLCANTIAVTMRLRMGKLCLSPGG
jgi:hypothetical protein